MRGEQRARTVLLVQMFDRRPGDGEAVEGRGAAADLVENDEAPLRRLIEDRRRLHHLDHEGRAPARQIVGGADAAEQAIDDADMRALRRHERAHLREDRDQRVLAQEGRFAGHVGTGDEPQASARLRGDRSQSLGTNGPACACAQRRFHNGMTAAHDLEGEAVDRLSGRAWRLATASSASADATSRRARAPAISDSAALAAMRFGRHRVEQFALDGERLFGGFRDAACERGEFVGREAHGAADGLAMTEQIARGDLPAIFRHWCGVSFDEIAQHAIVLDAQRRDAARPRDSALRGWRSRGGFRRARPALRPAAHARRGDEAAIAREERRLGDQQPFQRVGQRARARDAFDQSPRAPRSLRPAHGFSGSSRTRKACRATPARPSCRRATRPDRAGRRGRPTIRASARAISGARRRSSRKAPPQIGIACEERHRIVARSQSPSESVSGDDKPCRQFARASGRHRAIDDREQASRPRAGQGFRQFEIAPRRGIDAHEGALGRARERACSAGSFPFCVSSR